MKIALALQYIDKTLPTAIFIRHGEKLIAKTPADDEFSPLSNIGKQTSYELGQLFANEIGAISKIMSSPICRCLCTAQTLADGNKSSSVIEESRILRHAYVENPEEAYDAFCTLPMSEIVRRQVRYESLKGFRNIEDGSKNLINFAISRFVGNQIDVYITHDVLLSAFFFALTKTNIEKIEEEWFDYLDGMCLQLIEEDLLRIYRDTRVFDLRISTQYSSVVKA